MEYKFANPVYDDRGRLTSIAATDNNVPFGLYVPFTSTTGDNPKTSSISVYSAAGGNGADLRAMGAIYQGKPLDAFEQVGDTHPSAMAMVRQGDTEVLFVTKSNSDALGRILVKENRKVDDFDLSPVSLDVSGAAPNALAVSPDQTRLYVAEAGLNSVAVLDTSNPLEPKLLGRIATGAYPTAVAISPDGNTLYIANAKGVGEDVNPNTPTDDDQAPATGLQAVSGLDSNFIFGTVQKVDLATASIDSAAVLAQNFTVNPPADTSVVPAGGEASKKIKHVFFILKENKTFDSMLGNMRDHFGAFASMTFHDRQGKPVTNRQYTGATLNLQQYARAFASALDHVRLCMRPATCLSPATRDNFSARLVHDDRAHGRVGGRGPQHATRETERDPHEARVCLWCCRVRRHHRVSASSRPRCPRAGQAACRLPA